MSKNRSRRIDRDTAERLLGGGAVGSEAGQAPLTGHAALAGLLAAAAAPAGDGELPGERAALAAFREARRRPVPESGRAAVADAVRRRAFTVKALVAAFAVTAVGGVAVAAGTGGLPRALGGGASAARTPAAVHATAAGTAGPGRRSGGVPSAGASGRPDATGRPPASAGTTTPGAPVSLGPAALPELTRLCRSYLDREAAGRRRDLLTDLRFAPLVVAAGGVERVEAYCTALASAASPSASRSPGREPTTGPGKGDRTKTPSPSVTTRGGTENGAGPG